MADNINKIDFIIPLSSENISLSVFDSDLIHNAAAMEQVVGTLVKYSSGGRCEPYLAKSWIVSDDQKTWSFEFVESLKTEDGILINAESFAKNIKNLLNIYSKIYSPPTFNRLKGWDEFIKGDDSYLGITVSAEKKLIFSFEAVPSAFLEFLTMPYYGFYSPANFNNDEWADKNKIISSSSYKLVHYDKDEMLLEARKDWKLINENSPEAIIIRKADIEKCFHENKNFIVRVAGNEEISFPGMVSYNTPPTLLSAIVLSPFVKPFDSVDVRKAFRTVLRFKANEEHLKGSVSVKSNYFYNNFSNLKLEDMNYQQALKRLQKLNLKKLPLFVARLTNNNDSDFINRTLEKTILEIGWSTRTETPESIGQDWIQLTSDNKKFPIRVDRVDIGGSPENWVIDLMFCSRFGISFPDNNNHICEIVKSFESGDFANKEKYWEALHYTIEEDAIVVPLVHSGFSWLVSKSINLEKMTSTLNIPRFDQLSIKND